MIHQQLTIKTKKFIVIKNIDDNFETHSYNTTVTSISGRVRA